MKEMARKTCYKLYTSWLYLSGILRDKTMDDKLNIRPPQNYPFCRLNYWLLSLDTTDIQSTIKNHLSAQNFRAFD